MYFIFSIFIILLTTGLLFKSRIYGAIMLYIRDSIKYKKRRCHLKQYMRMKNDILEFLTKYPIVYIRNKERDDQRRMQKKLFNSGYTNPLFLGHWATSQSEKELYLRTTETIHIRVIGMCINDFMLIRTLLLMHSSVGVSYRKNILYYLYRLLTYRGEIDLSYATKNLIDTQYSDD